MNLHAEALDEFRKALKGAPAFRADLCRHIANCLIHIEKYEEAQRFLAQVLVDRNLTGEQKNEITNDTVGIYLELGLFRQAREFLERLHDEHKGLVRNYDRLVQELVSLSLHDEELEVVVEDEDTGEIYTVTQRVQRVHSPHVSPATSGPPVESRPENVSKRPAKTASEPEPRARPTKAPQQEIGAPSRVSESQPAVLTEEVRTQEEIPFACVCGKVHGAPI